MKRVAVLLIAIVIATTVFAQGLKIAFVDIERVFQSSKEKKAAETIFMNEAKEMQKKVEDSYKELIDLNQKFQNESAFLSKEEQQKKKQELITKQEAFEKLRTDMSQKADLRRNELMKPIMTSITTIVTNIRKEKAYDMILDKAAVVSGNDQLEITDQVIERVNAGK